jgi:hypothetical protein
MAQFAMMIYAPAPGDWSAAPDDELEAHGGFGDVADEAGIKSVAAFAFEPSTNAVAITNRGETVNKGVAAVDAPLVLGGFSVIEARDIDHAVEVAKKNPATWRGAVEIRPLLGGPEE